MNWKVEFTLGYGPATRANEFQLPGRGGGIAFRHRGISISHNRLRPDCRLEHEARMEFVV